MTDELQLLVESLAGIERGPALDGLAARWLSERTPEEAARSLDRLVGRPGLDQRQRKTLEALARAVLFGPPPLTDERRRAIRAAAFALGFGAVAALFTEASPALVRDEDARRLDPLMGSLSLGHRKQLARLERSPDRLVRLGNDDDPTVIRNLLDNPRLTEALVVRIAARRPIAEAVLVEVGRSRRWSVRATVRRALALNPDSPPALVNLLLPHLVGEDLSAVAETESLHPAVRAAARALLFARRQEVD